MATFLHIADVHLDSAFSAHFDTDGARVRRNEVRRCLSAIIDKAKSVDILLIAGDLFDGRQVSAETVSFLKRKFSELESTKVFIVAGNHDPYLPDSVYAKEDFGENVYVFGTKAECIELAELKTRVYGVSFGEEFCDGRLDVLPIVKDEGVSDILLLHGDVTSMGGESRYNGIDKSFIEKSGADYIALGHIHKRSELQRAGSTYYAYPGPPEGRGFDECGDMGYYIGSIKDGVVDVKFERSCIRRMLRIEADISGVSDNLEAAMLAKKKILEAGVPEDMYKLVLTGRVQTGIPDINIIKEEISSAVAYLEVKDETLPDYNIEEIEAQNTVCGEFVRIMKSKVEDADIIEEATAIGLEALLGGDI